MKVKTLLHLCPTHRIPRVTQEKLRWAKCNKYYLKDKRNTFSPSVKTFPIQVCLMTVAFAMVWGHNKVK